MISLIAQLQTGAWAVHPLAAPPARVLARFAALHDAFPYLDGPVPARPTVADTVAARGGWFMRGVAPAMVLDDAPQASCTTIEVQAWLPRLAARRPANPALQFIATDTFFGGDAALAASMDYGHAVYDPDAPLHWAVHIAWPPSPDDPEPHLCFRTLYETPITSRAGPVREDEEEQRVREAIAGYVRQFDPDVSAETCAWCTRIGERLPCDCPFRVCRACWANTLRCPNCRSLHGEDDDMMM